MRPDRIAPLLLAAAIACSGSRGGATEQGSHTSVPAKSIDDVLAAHRDALLALPGVVGTAIALYDGERCIRVMLADSSALAQNRIPARLEGYRVVAEVTGPFRPR